jgi:hypothetical protein
MKNSVAGNDKGITYSFESGKTFDKTLNKIEEVIKENSHLKQQIKVLTFPL